MTYLLDSNTVSDLYGKSNNTLSILSKLAEIGKSGESACISILTNYEAAYGVSNSPEGIRQELHKRYNQITNYLPSLPIPSLGAETFGKIKAEFVKKRNLNKNSAKKHATDLILAVTAIENNCILVSADSIYHDICKIDPRLKWQDWTKD